MKKLIFLLTLTLATSAFAFQLSITNNPDGTRVINHKDSEWVTAAHSTNYHVLVDADTVGTGKRNELTEFHSVTVFKTPEEYSGFPYKIKSIYTYGVMSCKRSSLMILVDLYVDSDGIIRYTQSHQQGEYVVDMNDIKMRRDILGTICGDAI